MVQQPNGSPGPATRRPGMADFYKTRQRFTLALLVFVVVIGLPIIGVPQLRNRLSERVAALKTAWVGERARATADVGANTGPLPAEFERPEPVVPRPPQMPGVDNRIYTMRPSVPLARSRPESQAASDEFELVPADTGAPSDAPAEPSAEAAAEPKYQRGAVEQEAYDLLLASNPTVAGLVQGSNPDLAFKSWDALSRGNEIYWVRLTFQPAGGPAAEYIWQVKLQSKEVTPLSHNARTLN